MRLVSSHPVGERGGSDHTLYTHICVSSDSANPLAARRLVMAAMATLMLTGCVLPIVHSTVVSPAVVGTYRSADGAPVVGRHIAISTTSADSSCRRAEAGTVTDSSGQFVLPLKTERSRGVWLFPAVERFGTPYWLCAGHAADSLLPMHRGMGARGPSGPPDSVSCVEARAPQAPACRADRQSR